MSPKAKWSLLQGAHKQAPEALKTQQALHATCLQPWKSCRHAPTPRRSPRQVQDARAPRGLPTAGPVVQCAAAGAGWVEGLAAAPPRPCLPIFRQAAAVAAVPPEQRHPQPGGLTMNRGLFPVGLQRPRLCCAVGRCPSPPRGGAKVPYATLCSQRAWPGSRLFTVPRELMPFNGARVRGAGKGSQAVAGWHVRSFAAHNWLQELELGREERLWVEGTHSRPGHCECSALRGHQASPWRIAPRPRAYWIALQGTARRGSQPSLNVRALPPHLAPREPSAAPPIDRRVA